MNTISTTEQLSQAFDNKQVQSITEEPHNLQDLDSEVDVESDICAYLEAIDVRIVNPMD